MGFLLSAERAIPVKLAKEITTADIRDISFLMFSPIINNINIIKQNCMVWAMLSQCTLREIWV